MCETSKGPECLICNFSIKQRKYYAVIPCKCSDITICGVCALRLRSFEKERKCPFCKEEWPNLLISPQVYDEPYCKIDMSTKVFDGSIDVYFETQEDMYIFRNLRSNHCVICKRQEEKYYEFTSMVDLAIHLRKEHFLYFCEVCAANQKIFPYEFELFTKRDIKRHKKEGFRSKNVAMDPHPECRFCKIMCFDLDALYEHLERKHIMCHFCREKGLHIYEADRKGIKRHFEKKHFICKEKECQQDLFVVFDNILDLNMHYVNFHGKNISYDMLSDMKEMSKTMGLNKERPTQFTINRQNTRENYIGHGSTARVGQNSGQNFTETTPAIAQNNPISLPRLPQVSGPLRLPFQSVSSSRGRSIASYSSAAANRTKISFPELPGSTKHSDLLNKGKEETIKNYRNQPETKPTKTAGKSSEKSKKTAKSSKKSKNKANFPGLPQKKIAGDNTLTPVCNLSTCLKMKTGVCQKARKGRRNVSRKSKAETTHTKLDRLIRMEEKKIIKTKTKMTVRKKNSEKGEKIQSEKGIKNNYKIFYEEMPVPRPYIYEELPHRHAELHKKLRQIGSLESFGNFKKLYLKYTTENLPAVEFVVEFIKCYGLSNESLSSLLIIIRLMTDQLKSRVLYDVCRKANFFALCEAIASKKSLDSMIRTISFPPNTENSAGSRSDQATGIGARDTITEVPGNYPLEPRDETEEGKSSGDCAKGSERYSPSQLDINANHTDQFKPRKKETPIKVAEDERGALQAMKPPKIKGGEGKVLKAKNGVKVEIEDLFERKLKNAIIPKNLQYFKVFAKFIAMELKIRKSRYFSDSSILEKKGFGSKNIPPKSKKGAEKKSFCAISSLNAVDQKNGDSEKPLKSDSEKSKNTLESPINSLERVSTTAFASEKPSEETSNALPKQAPKFQPGQKIHNMRKTTQKTAKNAPRVAKTTAKMASKDKLPRVINTLKTLEDIEADVAAFVPKSVPRSLDWARTNTDLLQIDRIRGLPRVAEETCENVAALSDIFRRKKGVAVWVKYTVEQMAFEELFALYIYLEKVLTDETKNSLL